MEIEKQSKKQVRRRLQTNKPYKDRLLNMAEARREIATALKYHRASMKQQETAGTHPPPEKPNSRLFPATAADNYIGTYLGLPFPPPPPPPLYQENLNLVLPQQTLGLNLNFQDFSNLKTSIYHTPMTVCSSSSASSSPAAKEVAVADSSGGIRSPEDDDGDGLHGYHPFDQVMEFPPWLINANESSCLQQFYDHQFFDEYSPDPALPCMDIGEIEGMDGEWLA
ncbi:hypothetical protein L2E82_50122 [Cichorium intybus]|nr:hypothetical protein L2E82_50122 [Cichorium intybus]